MAAMAPDCLALDIEPAMCVTIEGMPVTGPEQITQTRAK